MYTRYCLRERPTISMKEVLPIFERELSTFTKLMTVTKKNLFFNKKILKIPLQHQKGTGQNIETLFE